MGMDGIGVNVSQDKWDKTKCHISDLQFLLQESSTLDRKQLESVRGFFIHLQKAYPVITQFIKGLHVTINGWQEGWDEKLWKLESRKVMLEMNMKIQKMTWCLLPPLCSTVQIEYGLCFSLVMTWHVRKVYASLPLCQLTFSEHVLGCGQCIIKLQGASELDWCHWGRNGLWCTTLLWALCFCQLDMTGLLWLHIVHVAGICMVVQGTDGFSRGNMAKGVM